MASSTKDMIVPSVLGVLSGVAGTLLVGWLSPADRDAPATQPTHEAAPRDRARDESRRLLSRLRQVESEVERLSRVQTAEPAVAEPEERPAEPTPAEQIEASRAAWQKTLDDYAAEPIDHAWAREAVAGFDRDLRQVGEAQQSFELLDLECRTSTCRARLRFDSRERAIDASMDLLTSAYQLNCRRTVHTPEVEGGAANANGYIGNVYFHCGPTRGVEPAEQ